MTSHLMAWRRLDLPGRDVCVMDLARGGLRLWGVAALAWKGKSCALRYSVECDRAGRTRRADVGGFFGSRRISFEIEADLNRRWKLNGRRWPHVEGCEDIDLSFTPATNTLPIRRLALRVGSSAPVRAAWLRFPGFAFRPLNQVYRRLGRQTYEYRSDTFRARLRVDSAGLVTRYGGVWAAVPSASL